MADSVFVSASPSLALVKYWGKSDDERNLPATTSIGVTLSGMETRSAVSLASPADGPAADAPPADRVAVDGSVQPAERFAPFFEHLREVLDTHHHFHVESYNTFPTAAGLASSSSGFAALAEGCAAACGVEADAATVSSIALRGSASAARAVYGGFSYLAAGAKAARPLFPANHWPELRILAVALTTEVKPLSSREAMARSRRSSPYYDAWVTDSAQLAVEVEAAVGSRDIERLGRAMRLSYLRMVGTMISADPPFLYWHPSSVATIRRCESLRARGIAAWETMDAGPQVKIATTESDTDAVRNEIWNAVPDATIFETVPGSGAHRIDEQLFYEGRE